MDTSGTGECRYIVSADLSLRQSGPQTKWRGPDMFVADVAAEIE